MTPTVVLLLGACNDRGPADVRPVGSTATGDTGATTPPCDEEIVANGLDDDCDGWNDELGERGMAVSSGSEVLRGELSGAFLGETLAVADRGGAWVVAGSPSGIEYQLWPSGVQLPGGEPFRIEAFVGRAAAVGAFDACSPCIVLSDGKGFVGLYPAGTSVSLGENPFSSVPILPGADGGAFSYVAAAADLDGDGVDELVLNDHSGSPYDAWSDLYVLAGAVARPEWTNLRAHVLATYPPTQNFPYHVGEVLDYTGDGVPEIPAYSEEDAGRTWLIPGDVIGDVLLLDVATAELRGEYPDDDAGRSPAGGDANGDGYTDLLVGAPLTDDRRGAAYLALGPVVGVSDMADGEARFLGEHLTSWCGESLTFLPDSDGDGADDPVVACPGDSFGTLLPGRVQAYHGSTASGVLGLEDAAVYWVGDSKADLAGWNLRGKVDLTGDTVPDLAVAVPGDDTYAPNGGAVYVLEGPLL